MSDPSGTVIVRDVVAGDAARWQELYRGYREFYRLASDDSAVATAWRWVSGREHGLRGLVAEQPGGAIVALANLRVFARPSTGRLGLYLDDLFTAPDARGTGAATALLARAAELARFDDATVVRWITAADNTTARRLYDRHATATGWVTYDMAPTAGV